MKWETDWLYGLILGDIEKIWKRAVEEGRGEFGPSPNYLVVSQFANVSVQPCGDVDPKMIDCSLAGSIIKQWLFDDSGMRPKETPDDQLRKTRFERGMFYRFGTIDFHISSGRKLVVLDYAVGPRYGEHRVFRVQGQGQEGKLTPDNKFVWSRS